MIIEIACVSVNCASLNKYCLGGQVVYSTGLQITVPHNLCLNLGKYFVNDG